MVGRTMKRLLCVGAGLLGGFIVAIASGAPPAPAQGAAADGAPAPLLVCSTQGPSAGSGGSQIFTIREDGSDLRTLTRDGNNFYPTFSADGERIYFTSDRGGNPEIFVMGADGSGQRPVTRFGTGMSALASESPDGRRIAFMRVDPAVAPNPEIWVAGADGGDPRRLTTTPPAPAGPHVTWSVHPSWSPGGDAIVYASTAGGSTQVWIMNADGSGQRPLTSGSGPGYPDANVPSFSPDGSAIVFWSGFETRYGEVWMMNADGSNRRRLTDTPDPRNADNPAWSSDGRRVFFASNRRAENAVDIWAANVEGGEPVLFRENTAWVRAQPRPATAATAEVELPPGVSSAVLTTGPGRRDVCYNFGRSVVADDEGRLHAVWSEIVDAGAYASYRRSLDGGATWEPEMRLTDGAAAPVGHDHIIPAVAAAEGSVYVAWHEMREGGPEVRFRRSTDGGATWEPSIRLPVEIPNTASPSVAASERDVHVVCCGRTQVYYVHSPDGGAHWERAIQISDSSVVAWVPTVAVGGRRVYVAWVDTRDGNEEEYIRASADGGATFGPPVRLTDDRANSWAPSIAAERDVVHVVWFDQRDAPIQPREALSRLDAILAEIGAAPAPPLPDGVMVPHPNMLARLRATHRLQAIQQAAPGFAAAGGDAAALQRIMAEVQSLGAAGASYIQKEAKLAEASALLGLTYEPGPDEAEVPRIYYLDAFEALVAERMRRVQETGPGWVRSGGDPSYLEGRLHGFEQTLHAALEEWDIYYRRSTDGGATFSPAVRLTDAPGLSQRPSIAAAAGRLRVAWYDRRDGNVEVYLIGSEDGGTTWGPDVRLTRSAGDSYRPSAALRAGTTHVVWVEGLPQGSEIRHLAVE